MPVPLILSLLFHAMVLSLDQYLLGYMVIFVP
jgi:hypothetical protein